MVNKSYNTAPEMNGSTVQAQSSLVYFFGKCKAIE